MTQRVREMSTALKRITEEEYLRIERVAECKSEFYQGEIFAMAGGSATHSLIAANFVGEVRQSFKDKPCKVFNSDLRVRVEATGLHTYPDATLVCGEMEFADDQRDTLINPTVLVEVLSDSTEKYDRGLKANNYRQIESLRELVFIAQDRPHAERFTRQANGDWLFHEERVLTAMFDLPSVGISISLSEIYRGVDFPEANKR